MDLRSAHDLFRLLGDETRLRLLALLAEEELTVAELTELLGLAQSRVSTHLGRLRDAGLVKVRRHSQGSLYSVPDAFEREETRLLWEALSSRIHDPLLDDDRERARRLVDRRERPGTWADSVAGRMERFYSPGRTWQSTARALLGLVELGDILDVASGDGALIELLAPRARSVTCLDISPKVLGAARDRLADWGNVTFVQGDMHELPFDDSRFDHVLLLNALSYAERPPLVVEQASRVLRAGGALVATTLGSHAFREEARLYDHAQLGFETASLERLFAECGLRVTLCKVTHQEKRKPHFRVITMHARKLDPRS
ncbi:MAG: metalloregulator ArsR/SmtB family transcription factor [Myxococcales bacterium]|nr:metalloregulator ArsR/SmtB family transcription factor [Myxococcales bacterium]